MRTFLIGYRDGSKRAVLAFSTTEALLSETDELPVNIDGVPVEEIPMHAAVSIETSFSSDVESLAGVVG